jgi:hypothetical protein
MEQQGTNPPFIVTDGLTKTYIRREKPEHGGITRLWRRARCRRSGTYPSALGAENSSG